MMTIRVEHSIHTLCMKGDLESVMELIDNGTDINVGNKTVKIRSRFGMMINELPFTGHRHRKIVHLWSISCLFRGFLSMFKMK